MNHDPVDQHKAGCKLLSAVVGLAISDACSCPIRRVSHATMSDMALDAMKFIFTENCRFDLYMSLLNIDPHTFRSQLLRSMQGRRKFREITIEKQNVFLFNYELYQKLRKPCTKKKFGTTSY
jgi:hypothetical protein